MNSQALLSLRGATTVPAHELSFCAPDYFRVTRDAASPVPISFIDENFQHWFLGKEGTTVTPEPVHTLRYYALTQAASDQTVIGALGGEATSASSLFDLWCLLEAQQERKSRVLLENGHANIFYIRDNAHQLKRVHVYWNGEAWCIRAKLLLEESLWRAGRLVFVSDLTLARV